jgi:hypothetical protein
MGGKFMSLAGPVGYRNGEVVEVKSKEEILATLDEDGELDSLLFMPEMLRYCGQRIPIYRRAVRACDTASKTGMHRMDGAVHLQDARCDGSAHGGCQAACLLYWREEWLRPLSATTAESTADDSQSHESHGIGEAELDATTVVRDDHGHSVDVRYRCQATELMRATSGHIRWWDVGAYVRDVRSGNAKLLPMLRNIVIMLFNFFQKANRRFFPNVGLIHGAETYPFIAGRLRKTPREELDLRPGERVRVKSREAILATLDVNSRNRGLSFDREMLKYCGQEARVLQRVDHIINEQTGHMIKLPNDCIMLEGVVCAGDYNAYCPRSIYPYWREIWLERVEPTEKGIAPLGKGLGASAV